MTALQGMGLALAYLIGAIPVGLLIGLARGVDVRTVGSGNIGATNVLRGLGPFFGLVVFAVDVLKGGAGVVICRQLGMDGWLLGAAVLFAVLGHVFSPYLAFKGGKGVATTLGAMLALDPLVAALALGAWIVIVIPTRIVSLASILAAASVPVIHHLLNPAQPQVLVPLAALAIIVVGRHNENIGRLLRGEEHRFGSHTAEEDEEDSHESAQATE